jgi:hypothetical protein
MSSMRFNARLDMSHHGPPHPSDRHPKCDGEVPLRCQQELDTQGCLGVPTGKNPGDSNVASVEAMQWALLYLSIGHDIGNISYSAAKICRSTIMHVQHSCSCKSQIKYFRTHVDMDISFSFGIWNSCPNFSAHFIYYTLYNKWWDMTLNSQRNRVRNQHEAPPCLLPASCWCYETEDNHQICNRYAIKEAKYIP